MTSSNEKGMVSSFIINVIINLHAINLESCPRIFTSSQQQFSALTNFGSHLLRQTAHWCMATLRMSFAPKTCLNSHEKCLRSRDDLEATTRLRSASHLTRAMVELDFRSTSRPVSYYFLRTK